MDIRDMTRKQLDEYAKATHGIRFPGTMKNAEVIEKLELLEGAPANPTPVADVTLGPEVTPYKRVIINIALQDKPGGDRDVFVAVNGTGYNIKRGVNVSVPEPVVEALRNAVMTIYDQIHDNQGRVIDLKKRDALSYPFSIVGIDDGGAVAREQKVA